MSAPWIQLHIENGTVYWYSYDGAAWMTYDLLNYIAEGDDFNCMIWEHPELEYLRVLCMLSDEVFQVRVSDVSLVTSPSYSGVDGYDPGECYIEGGAEQLIWPGDSLWL